MLVDLGPDPGCRRRRYRDGRNPGISRSFSLGGPRIRKMSTAHFNARLRKLEQETKRPLRAACRLLAAVHGPVTADLRAHNPNATPHGASMQPVAKRATLGTGALLRSRAGSCE